MTTPTTRHEHRTQRSVVPSTCRTGAECGVLGWVRSRALGRVRGLAGQPERGDISIWVIMCVTVAFLLCMLLVDGSAKRQAAIQAHWYAAEAARAGANAVGPRAGGVDNAAGIAAQAARTYLSRAGVDGTVQVLSPTSVQVNATASRVGPMSRHTFTATETATADLLVGVETGQRR